MWLVAGGWEGRRKRRRGEFVVWQYTSKHAILMVKGVIVLYGHFELVLPSQSETVFLFSVYPCEWE